MTTSQFAYAIYDAFKNEYFSGIYTIENPRILAIMIREIMNFMVWINHQDIPLPNEVNMVARWK